MGTALSYGLITDPCSVNAPVQTSSTISSAPISTSTSSRSISISTSSSSIILPTPTPPPSNNNNNSNVASIAGGVAGGVAFLLACILFLCARQRRAKKRAAEARAAGGYSHSPSASGNMVEEGKSPYGTKEAYGGVVAAVPVLMRDNSGNVNGQDQNKQGWRPVSDMTGRSRDSCVTKSPSDNFSESIVSSPPLSPLILGRQRQSSSTQQSVAWNAGSNRVPSDYSDRRSQGVAARPNPLLNPNFAAQWTAVNNTSSPVEPVGQRQDDSLPEPMSRQ